MNNVWKVVIPNYEDKVAISSRRRAKYYKKGDVSLDSLSNKIRKNLKSGHYYWDKKNFLVDYSGNRILSNPLVAGKPKYWTINGQRMYDGTLHYAVRSKVARKMHEYLEEYVKDLPEIKLSEGEYLRVWIDMYKPIQKPFWDCDNQWPWTKWFLDTCVDMGKIPTDSIECIRSSGQITYIESDVKKLVFNIQIIRQ
tara:strand:- start:270 stop:857 length:588 start_codon:yes stop_codon:yes gene_type:complete